METKLKCHWLNETILGSKRAVAAEAVVVENVEVSAAEIAATLAETMIAHRVIMMTVVVAVQVEAAAVVVVAAVVVSRDSATGFATGVKTRTLPGETNAIAARNQKAVTMDRAQVQAQEIVVDRHSVEASRTEMTVAAEVVAEDSAAEAVDRAEVEASTEVDRCGDLAEMTDHRAAIASVRIKEAHLASLIKVSIF